jgi:hypothetical protein
MNDRRAICYGIAGSGWRAEFFLRVAKAMPSRFTVTGVVTRSGERGSQVERKWAVPTFHSVQSMIGAERPQFVVACVPSRVAPGVITDLVQMEIPVLAETPPAADLPGLRMLWSAVGASGLVQISEQYLMMPGHAARLSLLRCGLIGEITSIQISSTHLHHAVSIMRRMLDVGFANAAVTARSFSAPLADPFSRAGWADDIRPKDTNTTLAIIDFGRRMGLYDFTDNQWLNPLRTQRIVVRGMYGELVDDCVTRLVNPGTVVQSHLVRRQTGVELNLEGLDLDHISHDGAMIYRNPFQGARLADDEIAVATMLDRMASWCRGKGTPPCPLADASQDHMIGLAIQESLKTGSTIVTSTQPWAR